MTSRERFISAARGAEVDRKPTIAWPGQGDDAFVAPADGYDDSLAPAGALKMAEVPNPFGLALSRGIDLNRELRENPTGGAYDGLVDEVRHLATSALAKGADGVLYRLHGARAYHCSPMQYGGQYLEGDREILGDLGGAAFNLIFAVGAEDLYLEFISDLPAQAFGWDVQGSGKSVASVRALRPGLLAAADAEADIFLSFPTPISQAVEIQAKSYV